MNITPELCSRLREGIASSLQKRGTQEGSQADRYAMTATELRLLRNLCSETIHSSLSGYDYRSANEVRADDIAISAFVTCEIISQLGGGGGGRRDHSEASVVTPSETLSRLGGRRGNLDENAAIVSPLAGRRCKLDGNTAEVRPRIHPNRSSSYDSPDPPAQSSGHSRQLLSEIPMSPTFQKHGSKDIDLLQDSSNDSKSPQPATIKKLEPEVIDLLEDSISSDSESGEDTVSWTNEEFEACFRANCAGKRKFNGVLKPTEDFLGEEYISLQNTSLSTHFTLSKLKHEKKAADELKFILRDGGLSNANFGRKLSFPVASDANIRTTLKLLNLTLFGRHQNDTKIDAISLNSSMTEALNRYEDFTENVVSHRCEEELAMVFSGFRLEGEPESNNYIIMIGLEFDGIPKYVLYQPQTGVLFPSSEGYFWRTGSNFRQHARNGVASCFHKHLSRYVWPLYTVYADLKRRKVDHPFKVLDAIFVSLDSKKAPQNKKQKVVDNMRRQQPLSPSQNHQSDSTSSESSSISSCGVTTNTSQKSSRTKELTMANKKRKTGCRSSENRQGISCRLQNGPGRGNYWERINEGWIGTADGYLNWTKNRNRSVGDNADEVSRYLKSEDELRDSNSDLPKSLKKVSRGGEVVTKKVGRKSLDGDVLGCLNRQCLVRYVNGQYEEATDEEVTALLKKDLSYQSLNEEETDQSLNTEPYDATTLDSVARDRSGILSSNKSVTDSPSENTHDSDTLSSNKSKNASDSSDSEDEESESENASDSSDSEEEESESEELKKAESEELDKLEKLKEALENEYSLEKIMNTGETGKTKNVPLKHICRRSRQWKKSTEIQKIVFMTGLITRTGCPDGAPSELCKTRTQLNKSQSRLFNYLVLILSVTHVERVTLLQQLEEHEKEKKESGIDEEEATAITEGLSSLHDIVAEIDIDYNEEQNKYSYAEVEDGHTVTYTEAVFEVRPLQEPIQEVTSAPYFIKLTARQGLNALKEVEEDCMDNYVLKGFANKCKMICESNSEYTEDMFFISQKARTNRAMKYKTILYNSESWEAKMILDHLHNNPGKWLTESIKDKFMVQKSSNTRYHFITSIKHLLCDETRNGVCKQKRKYVRLTQHLYPEGEPNHWKNTRGKNE